MADRPLLKPAIVMKAVDMSMNENGLATIMNGLSMLSYAFSWSGSSPVGAISIQFSNDYSLDATGQIFNPGTWTTVAFLSAGSYVTSVAVSGNSGNGFIDIDATAAYAVRPVYTATSGTGSLTCVVNGRVT